MDPLTIISILSSVAPMITKWVGAGKDVQAVADKASSIAAIVTGKTDVNEQAAALQANPELLAAYQKALLDQETTFEQMYVDDKADARKRDVALSSTPQGNVRANWLVGFAMLMIVAILLIVIFRPLIDEYVKTTLTLIIGMFLNELKNIYSFEFGTTRRSREKTDVIDSLNQGK